MAGIAAVILAAGASRRMGRPKQLLPFRGRTLLRHTVEEVLAGGCGPVVVVLGACLEEARRELAELPVHIAENREWDTGMGSSIRAGMAALCGQEGSGPEAVLLSVCDQPGFTAAVVRRLAEAFRSHQDDLVAAAYGGTVGVPALFPRALFPQLLSLNGAEGARKVIHACPRLRTVPFPEGLLDIDTPEDYARLRGEDTDSR